MDATNLVSPPVPAPHPSRAVGPRTASLSRWDRPWRRPVALARVLERGHRAWWLAGLLATFLATTGAWLPWLDPRLNMADLNDARNHMHRLYLLGWMMQHGVWYPRWLPDLFMGYGYPVLNYYAPGAYYLGALLGSLLRLGAWEAFRAVGLLAALLGAAGVYAFTVSLWQRATPGILAAATVLYGPYVFQMNLFKKGDVPEALGLALLPWLLLAIWRLWLASTASTASAASTPSQVNQVQSARCNAQDGDAGGVRLSGGRCRARAWLAAAVAAGAAAILAHNVSAVLAAAAAAVWVTYLFLSRPSSRALAHVLAAGVLAAGVTAFFWLPAVGETSAVQLERLQEGQLRFDNWLIDPGGNTPAQRAAENRQTRTGLIDTHLHYPHQLAATPKLSLAQAGLGALALAVATAQVVRRRGSPLLPLLAIAGACWLLTFTVSAPLWEHLPGLALLQLPYRLLGPLGVTLAVAGAGALATISLALERRCGPPGRLVGWGTAVLLGAGVLFNSLGDRAMPLAAVPHREIDRRTLLENEREDRLGMGSTSTREFTPRDVQIDVYNANQAPDRGLWWRLYPEQEWTGDLFYPLAGDLRLLNWRTTPLRLSVRLANDAAQPGQLGIRQLRFPGWRAWIDGRPVPVGVAPYVAAQQANLGFIAVAVPPGEHTLTVAFGPTPLRLLGMGITLLAVLLICLAPAWRSSRSRQRRGWGAQGAYEAGAILAGCLLLLAGAGYLTWRGVRPLFFRSAAQPVPVPRAAGGTWRAADLAGNQSGLVVNLAEAVRTSQALVESPSGPVPGPDNYVDVRQLTVDDQADPQLGIAGVSRHQWLFLHPPATVAVDVALPPGREAWFLATLALDPVAWDAPAGDGVQFRVEVARLEGAPGTPPAEVTALALDRTLNPRAQTEDRRWVPLAVNLTPFAGQTIRLRLRTLLRDDLNYDWSGWGNPVVVIRESGRAYPPPDPQPTPG